jgi:hypothetical protein
MLIFLLIGVAVIGGVAYYFKIVKPKQRSSMDDDDGLDYDDDDGYSDYNDADNDYGIVDEDANYDPNVGDDRE